MMGLIGAGNNPMVDMTIAVAVTIEEACKQSVKPRLLPNFQGSQASRSGAFFVQSPPLSIDILKAFKLFLNFPQSKPALWAVSY